MPRAEGALLYLDMGIGEVWDELLLSETGLDNED